MQILFENSEEGNLPGLGIIKGNVIKIPDYDKNKNKYKIPHMGWNQIETSKNSKIFSKIKNKSNFYFVHSFQCIPVDEKIITSKANYSVDIVASIEQENLFAVQFHPEKSSNIGLKVYENFINLIRKD